MDIRFTEIPNGYLASNGLADAIVSQVPGGWSATFEGNPRKRNPVTRDPTTGAWVQDCTCPTVEVPGTFRSRDLAASAGINARAAEMR